MEWGNEDENLLVLAHRYARQASEAHIKGHWQQAIDKHTRAADHFEQVLQSRRHIRQAVEALQLLIDFHLSKATQIRLSLQLKDSRPTSLARPTLVEEKKGVEMKRADLDGRPKQIVSHYDNEGVGAFVVEAPLTAPAGFSTSRDTAKFAFDSSTAGVPNSSNKDSSADVSQLLDRMAQLFAPVASTDYSERWSQLNVQSVSALSRVESRFKRNSDRDVDNLIDAHNALLTYARAQEEENRRLRQSLRHISVTGSLQLGELKFVLRRPSSANSNQSASASSSASTSATDLVASKAKLEKDVAYLTQQLEAETALRQKQAKTIEKYQERWSTLKEAARKKRSEKSDSGPAVDPRS